MNNASVVFSVVASLVMPFSVIASEPPRSLLQVLEDQGELRDVGTAEPGLHGADLVVNPIVPCRLLDTRVASQRGGPLLAGETRAFLAYGEDFSATQGGAEGDCGLGEGIDVQAILVNLTVVEPRKGGGYAIAWPMGEERPLAASLTYAQGQVVSNEVLLPIHPATDTEDFQVFTYREAHMVADVVAYLSRPTAAALDCVLGPVSEDILESGANYALVEAPACPMGYSEVAPLCDTVLSSAFVVAHGAVPGFGAACAYRNDGAGTATVYTAATCCRVSGRSP